MLSFFFEIFITKIEEREARMRGKKMERIDNSIENAVSQDDFWLNRIRNDDTPTYDEPILLKTNYAKKTFECNSVKI